jgi:hypothetical protein
VASEFVIGVVGTDHRSSATSMSFWRERPHQPRWCSGHPDFDKR